MPNWYDEPGRPPRAPRAPLPEDEQGPLIQPEEADALQAIASITFGEVYAIIPTKNGRCRKVRLTQGPENCPDEVAREREKRDRHTKGDDDG